MKIVSSILRTSLLCFALLAVGATLPAAGSESEVPNWNGWLEGPAGLSEAIKIQSETGKPMFVYFYTDWCGYCRQFEKVLLTDNLVEDYFDSIIAVRLNAEGGADSSKISQMYGVNGYPALFMHSSRSRTVSRVTRMEQRDGKARLLEGEDFVRELRNAASR
jgi:thiol:disulfide interchange protein DsbD